MARRRLPLTLTSLAALLASLSVALTPAAASSTSINAVTFTRATHTSLTFTVTGHASRYRVYVAKVHHQLIAADLKSDPSSGWSKSTTLTVTGLKYSTTPYYFRVLAESGSRHAYSDTFGPVGLQPNAPTGLTVARPFGAVSLSWSGGTGTGYVVERASDADFTTGTTSYSLAGPDQQFTPGDLTRGASYFFRVRAVNTRTPSAPSNVASGGPTTSGSPISAMTYNIREATLDGQPDGKNLGASWSQRKGPAAALIRTAMPDVVAVEEGASFVDGSTTERQVDSLVSALGSPYRLARTEIPPTEKHYFRTGDYIIYNSNVVSADDPAGPYPDHDYWDLGESSLGNQHWAVYQQFTDLASSAKFLFVAFHLVQVNTNPSADDAARERQARSMIGQADSFAAGLRLPVVYAGDTNSAVESSHPVDGPRVAMEASGIDDAADVAQSRHNAKYNTGNQYFAKPPASFIYLDAVFGEAGVGMTSWDELLNLSEGRFVTPIPSDHNPVVAGVIIQQ